MVLLRAKVFLVEKRSDYHEPERFSYFSFRLFLLACFAVDAFIDVDMFK